MNKDFSLDSKYTATEGTILLSGAQALVRLLLDQRRADQARNLNTAGLVSGYRGSPLAGFDTLLQRSRSLLEAHQVTFIPGVNEDLGATAVMGSQIANLFPNPKYEGVFGMWYGKAPGVDRSGDVFKHANFAGVGRYGGVLAVAGDDAGAKSSTIPSHSEVALYDALMPVLVPGNVQEVLDFGRIGFELSRFCGLWVGFKIATNVADEFATAVVGSERLTIVTPDFRVNGRPWQATQQPNLVPPYTAPIEQEIFEGRMAAASAFGAANSVNHIRVPAPGAWLGLVASGKTYYELRQALFDVGLDDAALNRYGVRLLQVGMLFPLDEQLVRSFAQGLEEIIVVEEKRAFLELFVRDALYHLAERPAVLGKRDEAGKGLIPADGELDADRLAPLLHARLSRRIPAEALSNRLGVLRGQQSIPVLTLMTGETKRTAYYCSGCPHNRSTVLPEGSLAGGGIGCHGMALHIDKSRPTHIGVTHMGGEGAQWVGAAPFSNTPHLFQNLGDGTLAHSGSLAIRQAVAAGTNITYKILYNKAVGMTGGQEVDGTLPVPELTRSLESEGVRRIIVTTEDPEQYGSQAHWARGVEVWHRDRLDEAQVALRDTPGVTVLIHDQACAAELRRLRKRGKAYDPPKRIFINEAVCEGCGDCGVKSNCLSVQPVDTEFGRKTQIHQSSCNKDYSCLLGDCPAFITLEPVNDGKSKAKKPLLQVDEVFPEPTLLVGDMCNIYMMGIGGTGVVTVNQVLGTAALLEGKAVDGLDQTGLSQKGGPVVSHLKISGAPTGGSNKIGLGEADCFLAFDILTATQTPHLNRARTERTVAVVSTSAVATGQMVASTEMHFPANERLLDSIRQRVSPERSHFFDAVALAEGCFGDHMAANMIVLGAAYQAGAIPVSAAAIEQALQLNGTAVAMNTNAFRLGRRLVANPAWLAQWQPTRPEALAVERPISPAARRLIDSLGASGELLRLLEIRVPELIAYQNAAYARSYVEFVGRVQAAERRAVPGQSRLSEAVARYLFKLMAYKDEYEVARLSLTTGLDEALARTFGPVQKQRYMLHPPILRALGVKKKLAFGPWFNHAYRLLMRLKGLRGTPFDIFGYDRVRRVERALIGEYRGLIEAALATLTPENYDRAVKLAELPDIIRGYEHVKLANVERFRKAVADLGFGKDATPQGQPAVARSG
ncbi:MAG: indolepyruvate ferredoxin oxidoreductase family protein [Chloroflexaceae bacterium]|jgi:indolepyruvate ferredoxin oxidoreductase|nr:indolepyruvate ferredoxin oxidoreductase family protein [Chloroflexaceae bacterium]